jgi:hypothetical protein
MRVFVRLCLCTRRMVTVIAARRCMRVWKCVFGLGQGAMLTVIAARRCMRVWKCVCGLVQGVCSR